MHESVFMHSSLKLPFQNQYYRIINTLIMKDSSQSRFLLPSLTLPNIFLAQVFPSLFFIISFVDLEIEWYFRLVWSLPVSYSFSLSLPFLLLLLYKSFAQSDFVRGKFQFGMYVWCCAVCCAVWIQLRANSSTEIRCRTRTNTHNVTQATVIHRERESEREIERGKEGKGEKEKERKRAQKREWERANENKFEQ